MDHGQAQVTWDTQVRRQVYDYVIREGAPPSVAAVAVALGHSTEEVAAAFRRLADAHWCNEWSKPFGAILLLEQCWQLAKAWYGPDRRDPEWRRKTVDEAEGVFAQLGLIAPFWRLRP